MARKLFFSEWSILQTMTKTANRGFHDLAVVGEYHAPPRIARVDQQWFNTDFNLEFQKPLPLGNCSIDVLPIRPATFGAEFFLTSDERGHPAMLELLGGEAFPKSAYSRETQLIRQVLQETPWCAWQESFDQAAFLRVVGVSDRIIFMAATTTDIPSFAQTKAEPFVCPRAEVYLRFNESHSLIEGVVTTD